MPVINFSAVASTDIFTSTAHGLLTGDGAAQSLVAGGVAGGLNEANDYYIRRLTADTYTLHPTAADATVGTNVINVTADTNGQLAIGLPFRRARTYVALSQVKSADLNSIQDSLIGKKHGLVKVSLPPVIVNNAVGATWQLNAGDFVQSTGSGIAQFDVPCEIGDTILGVEILAQGNTTVDATIDLYYLSTAMAQSSIATLTDSNRAAAWGFAIVSGLLVDPPTVHKMADGERLRLAVNANAAGYMVGQIKLIKHRGV